MSNFICTVFFGVLANVAVVGVPFLFTRGVAPINWGFSTAVNGVH